MRCPRVVMVSKQPMSAPSHLARSLFRSPVGRLEMLGRQRVRRCWSVVTVAAVARDPSSPAPPPRRRRRPLVDLSPAPFRPSQAVDGFNAAAPISSAVGLGTTPLTRASTVAVAGVPVGGARTTGFAPRVMAMLMLMLIVTVARCTSFVAASLSVIGVIPRRRALL